MWLPPCAAVSDREGVVLCADMPSAGMHAMDPRLNGVALRRHHGCRGDANHSTEGARAMAQNLSMVGIDLAKSVLHLVGMDARGTSWYGSASCAGQYWPVWPRCYWSPWAWKPCGGPMIGHDGSLNRAIQLMWASR